MTQVHATKDSIPSSDLKTTHLDNEIIGHDRNNVLQQNKGISLEEEEIFILNKAQNIILEYTHSYEKMP